VYACCDLQPAWVSHSPLLFPRFARAGSAPSRHAQAAVSTHLGWDNCARRTWRRAWSSHGSPIAQSSWSAPCCAVHARTPLCMPAQRHPPAPNRRKHAPLRRHPPTPPDLPTHRAGGHAVRAPNVQAYHVQSRTPHCAVYQVVMKLGK